MSLSAGNYFPIFRSAIARIFHANGAVVGAGFLVSGRSHSYILTCAHVVTQALSLPRDTVDLPRGNVYLDFPLILPEQKFTAKVVFWRSVQASSAEPEDIAGLEIEGQLPSEAQPIKLISANDLWGHSLRIFGFPSGHNDGVWATGVLRDKQAKGWVQIEDIKVTGYRVEPGFSGAPIWDETLMDVVGMAVAAEKQREDVKAAFMIPADVLVNAWAELEQVMGSTINRPTSILNRVKQVQCQGLKKRLDSLISNYEVAYNQLNYTLSAVDRNIIQNQIDAIEQDMHKVASEMESLGCE